MAPDNERNLSGYFGALDVRRLGAQQNVAAQDVHHVLQAVAALADQMRAGGAPDDGRLIHAAVALLDVPQVATDNGITGEVVQRVLKGLNEYLGTAQEGAQAGVHPPNTAGPPVESNVNGNNNTNITGLGAAVSAQLARVPPHLRVDPEEGPSSTGGESAPLRRARVTDLAAIQQMHNVLVDQANQARNSASNPPPRLHPIQWPTDVHSHMHELARAFNGVFTNSQHIGQGAVVASAQDISQLLRGHRALELKSKIAWTNVVNNRAPAERAEYLNQPLYLDDAGLVRAQNELAEIEAAQQATPPATQADRNMWDMQQLQTGQALVVGTNSSNQTPRMRIPPHMRIVDGTAHPVLGGQAVGGYSASPTTRTASMPLRPPPSFSHTNANGRANQLTITPQAWTPSSYGSQAGGGNAHASNDNQDGNAYTTNKHTITHTPGVSPVKKKAKEEGSSQGTSAPPRQPAGSYGVPAIQAPPHGQNARASSVPRGRPGLPVWNPTQKPQRPKNTGFGRRAASAASALDPERAPSGADMLWAQAIAQPPRPQSIQPNGYGPPPPARQMGALNASNAAPRAARATGTHERTPSQEAMPPPPRSRSQSAHPVVRRFVNYLPAGPNSDIPASSNAMTPIANNATPQTAALAAPAAGNAQQFEQYRSLAHRPHPLDPLDRAPFDRTVTSVSEVTNQTRQLTQDVQNAMRRSEATQARRRQQGPLVPRLLQQGAGAARAPQQGAAAARPLQHVAIAARPPQQGPSTSMLPPQGAAAARPSQQGASTARPPKQGAAAPKKPRGRPKKK